MEANDWLELAIIIVAILLTIMFFGPFVIILIVVLCLGKYWDLKKREKEITAHIPPLGGA